MKYKVAATEALLRKMSSRQIMHLLNEWSVRYFMRRNMIRLQGMFLIIGLPDELVYKVPDDGLSGMTDEDKSKPRRF